MNVARILCKRDDLTGLEVSGNKIRKLEYLIADARNMAPIRSSPTADFSPTIVAPPPPFGARLGMKVRLLLCAPATEPENDGNLFLDRLFGAHITMHPASDYNTRRKDLIEQAMADERATGRKPYFFPVGASVPLGCWGYIRCFRELLDQLGHEAKIDLFAPVSSAGTFAGLVLGKRCSRPATGVSRAFP